MRTMALALALTASAATAHASSQLDYVPFVYTTPTLAPPSYSDAETLTAAGTIAALMALCLFSDLCSAGPPVEEEPKDCLGKDYRQGDCLFLDQAERVKPWEGQ